jgi:hypothetical protein
VVERIMSLERLRWVAPLSVAFAVALGVTGCTADGPDVPAPDVPAPGVTSPGPTPAPSAAPPSPADRAAQAALDAYRGMWQDFATAGTNSDWQSPLLGQHATGIALTILSRSLYADSYNGLVTRGEPILNPSVASVEPPDDPTRVIVTDCGDSTNWLKHRKDTDEVVEGNPGGRRLINAIVEKQADGSWKVNDYGVHEIGTC